jgi:membrane-associated protein
MARRARARQAGPVLADLMNAATVFVDRLSTLDRGAVLIFTFLGAAVEMTFCGYAVGCALGPRLRGTRLGRRIGVERFERAEAYLRDRGAPALVAVRFVAVVHALVRAAGATCLGVVPLLARKIKTRFRYAFSPGPTAPAPNPSLTPAA